MNDFSMFASLNRLVYADFLTCYNVKEVMLVSKKVVVSACLMGRNCKYNGGNNYNERLVEGLKGYEVIEVCPEVAAGMPVPRPAVEILNGRIVRADGSDWDDVYRKGVEAVLKQLEGEDIAYAVLQSRSPTCGVKEIYDGTFSKKRRRGQGILAQALAEQGILLI